MEAERRLSPEIKLTIAFAVWLLAGIFSFQTYWDFTLTDSLYLMAQIITTVGYGDAVPTTDEGCICMAIYVLWGVVVVAGFVSSLIGKLVEAEDQVFQAA